MVWRAVATGVCAHGRSRSTDARTRRHSHAHGAHVHPDGPQSGHHGTGQGFGHARAESFACGCAGARENGCSLTACERLCYVLGHGSTIDGSCSSPLTAEIGKRERRQTVSDRTYSGTRGTAPFFTRQLQQREKGMGVSRSPGSGASRKTSQSSLGTAYSIGGGNSGCRDGSGHGKIRQQHRSIPCHSQI